MGSLDKRIIKRQEIMTKKLHHIALIMDGNRRWARQKGLPTFIGHDRGYKRIETIVDAAPKYNISHLTFWAFSTENWKREEKEVSYLMNLFRKLFKSAFIKKMMRNGIRIQVLGDMTPFPKDIQENVQKILDQSKDNTNMTVNIALNYGGRPEILQAVNQLLKDGKKEITEEMFSGALYTTGQPDPDMIIRTGGEQRLSGYLPWQGVYSELYFTEKFWPDFDEQAFDAAIQEYYGRERRFGK